MAKKAKPIDVAADLDRARRHLSTLEIRIVEADASCDDALLADEQPAVERAEARRAALGHDLERTKRRIRLLEERAASELHRAQVKAQGELIERVTAMFAERNTAVTELSQALDGAIAAFRRADALNRRIATAWPFDYGQTIAAALDHYQLQLAVEHEIYRKSPVSAQLRSEFPGGRCPRIDDLRPEIIPALVDRIAEAGAYAIGMMNAAPIRKLAPEPAPATREQAVAPKMPAATATVAQVMDQVHANSAVRPTAKYRWFVDFVDGEGMKRTETVDFDADNLQEASLDGLDGTGARARELAVRLASEKVPGGYQFDGSPGSVRFDMAALEASLDGEDLAA